MRRSTLWILAVCVCALAVAVEIGLVSSQHSYAKPGSLLARLAFQAGRGKAGANAAAQGFATSNLDPKVKPCTNFYEYANGGWMAKNPIPPAYPWWTTFSELAERNRNTLRRILDKDAADKTAAPGSNTQKLGDFYASCMNVQEVDAKGIKPLAPEFQRIDQIHDVPSLQAEIAHLQGIGVDAVFGFGSEQDFKNSTMVIGDAGQGGLGLPNCTYYTKQDAKSKQIRAQYVDHVTKMFGLLGDKPDEAASEAATVMNIETQLAKASKTPVELRDPKATYNKMDMAQLKTLAPAISWQDYFDQIGHPEMGAINVDEPLFFKQVNTALTSVPLPQWKTYLRWHLITASAPYLSKPFVDEHFNFYGKILTGTQQILPRWKRCVRSTDGAIGMALGEQYVQVAFPPSAKARALAMVNNLITALRSDISTLSWMGPSTRKYAIAKLNLYMKKIGYPSKWRDYSALHITKGPYVNNVAQANLFELHRELNKIGKPVDRTEWGMTPPTVNAYYNPLMNEIVFPAGILQPPFFNPKADDAVNYGAIGVVIGHEMTHGFDDEGRQFDAHGNLVDWWTPQDLKRFQARAQCVVNEFNGFVVDGKLHENGNLVEGESIADLGGLAIAYAAFQQTPEAKSHQKIDGFTPDQRFFLGFAQIWATNARPAFVRLLTQTDPHPLNRFRVNGPLSNMPAFAKAWDCKPGDSMVRPHADQCKIW
ncbi:MAG: M13 family metallopeptidase [Terriglobia bacterium]